MTIKTTIKIKIEKVSTSYSLVEKTLADVAKKVSELEELASASYNVEYNYTTNTNGKVDKVDLIVTLSMKMPVWLQYKNCLKQAEKDEWDRVYKALKFHEGKHHALYKKEVAAIPSKLRKMAIMPEQLEKFINDETNRINSLDKEFDNKVDHGKKQTSPYGNTIINLENLEP